MSASATVIRFLGVRDVSKSAGPAPSQQMDNEEPLIIYLAIDFFFFPK